MLGRGQRVLALSSYQNLSRYLRKICKMVRDKDRNSGKGEGNSEPQLGKCVIFENVKVYSPQRMVEEHLSYNLKINSW